MFAHLSNTLEGLFLIRLYRAEGRFDQFNRSLIDSDHKALYSLLIVKAFMSACLDTVTSVFIFISALFCVVFPISPSQVGVAMTNVLQLLLFVPWLVKMIYILNGSMNSVSSLLYFGDHVPKETRSKSNTIPPEGWPLQGEVEFQNITSRYQRYGVSVLKNVSFHIEPREKIAIVGRSGSGKSTILMSLLRILEPTEGKVIIDGVDTQTISLQKLRSRVAVIPQEPVMLTGTIRTNLDPDGLSTDDDIWKALKAVHLGEKINEMPEKLETPITGTFV
jgi:ABC-type multidrug transport system fused ATPase/permease subunit